VAVGHSIDQGGFYFASGNHFLNMKILKEHKRELMMEGA
jgi:hypothetical protein